MPDLLGNRNYNEKEVLTQFTWSGSFPVNKGTFVKIAGDGWTSSGALPELLGAFGAAYTNVQAQRYGAAPKVVLCDSGSAPIGLLLEDGRETDENGLPLKYFPQKQAERGVFISGQTVRIATRGYFLYSGIDGTVTANQTLYVSGGALTTFAFGGTASLAYGHPVGKALGVKDANGCAYVYVNLPNI